MMSARNGAGLGAWTGGALAVLAAAIAGCSPSTGVAERTAAHPVPAAAQAGTCVSVARSERGGVHDTRIAERWPDRNYGDQPVAFTGAVGDADRATLLAFDLALAPGTTITRATLVLTHTTCPTCERTPVTVHRIVAPWDEHTVTWQRFANAYAPEPIARRRFVFGEEAAVGFDVTAQVQRWVDGVDDNHGVLLRQSGSSTTFATSESSVASERPRLEVCYRTDGAVHRGDAVAAAR